MFLKDLVYASKFAAKSSDLREYLSTVCVTPTQIIGSNGHILGIIKRETVLPEPELNQLLIPISAVNSFIKKHSKKDYQTLFVEIEKLGDKYMLKSALHSEVFEAVDRKYPDFTVALNQTEKEKDPSQIYYNFEYMSLAQLAIDAFYGIKDAYLAVFEFRKAYAIFEDVEITALVMKLNFPKK